MMNIDPSICCAEPYVETNRLRIFPVSNSVMQSMINNECDDEMKVAYQEMLEGCLSHKNQRIWYAVWQIADKETGQIVGDLCFKGISTEGMTEIGYGIYAPYQNKGYASEAITAISRWAIAQKVVKRLEAETDKDNIISQKVLYNSGYIPTGTVGKEGPRFVYSSE